MSKNINFFLFFIWLSPLCAQVESGAYNLMLKTLLDHSVPEITVANAAKLGPQTVFLDAREPNEYAISHLKGAVPVGYDHFQMTSVSHLPKDTPIVVYCSVGYRSEKIAEKLKVAGYTKVSNLYGGIFEWVNQKNIVYDTDGETQRVHAYDRTWGVWLRRGKKVYGKR